MNAARGVRHPWLALCVLCVSVLIVTVDNTILNVALPTLVRELGATDRQLQWIVDAYALVLAGLLLVSGSLADRLGRKRLFLTGLITFAAASTWAAGSGSVATLIAARASMGVGAALILPATLSIVTGLFAEPAQRQRAFGIWAGMSGLGIAIGPIAGGLLLNHYRWGSVFLVNVPVAAVGLAAAIPLVPDSRDPAARRPDPVGAVTSITGLTLLLWAIIEAPSRGWSSGPVLGVGLAALVVLSGFVVWELHLDHPMLSLSFFRRPRFSSAVSSVGLAMFGLFGTMFVLTQYMQFQLGYTAVEAGARILPVAAVLAGIAPLSTAIVRWIGTKAVVTAGLLCLAAGLGLLSRATVGSSYGDTLWGMILLGAGAGLVMPATIGSALGSVPAARSGVASATNGVFLQVGGALGVAVVGSLMSTRYQDRMADPLAAVPLPPAAKEAALGSIGGALDVASRLSGPAAAALGNAARSAFMSGMQLGMLVAAVVAVCSALVALVTLPARAPAPPPEADVRADPSQHQEAVG